MARLIDRFIAGLGHDEAVAPVAKLVGFRPTAIEAGKAVFELEAGPQHANPMGTLHGGIICDVADPDGTPFAGDPRTNLKRVLLRRGALEPTGETRGPGPSGGRPAALFRFRTRRLEITDPFAVLRPPR